MKPELTGRRAFVCRHKECQPPNPVTRIFLLPGEDFTPKCPTHGSTMERQRNMPYKAGKGVKR